MTRKLALISALLFGAVALLFLLRGDPLPEAVDGGDDAAQPAVEREADAMAAEPASAPGQAAPPERHRVESPSAAPVAADRLRFRVVEKDGGAPVPGATVRFLRADLDWSKLTPEQHLELQVLAFDREAWYERWGDSALTDAEGCVDVPRLRWGCACTARKGRLYGELHVDSSQVPPKGSRVFDVAVAHDLAVDLRVVDAAGTPVPGVGILLQTKVRWPMQSKDQDHTRPVGRTGAKGELALRHLQIHGQNIVVEGERKPARVRVDIPGHQDEGVTFDAGNPPEEPIELVAPATGSIAVQVLDVRGERVTERATVRLRVADPRQQPRSEMPYEGPFGPDGTDHAPLVDGAAEFPRVALGKTYEVRVFHPAEPLVRQVAGPVRAGQRIAAVLQFTRESIVLRGRALDAERRPLAGLRLSLQFRIGGGQSEGQQVGTDAAGAFRLVVGGSLRGKDVEYLELAVLDERWVETGETLRVERIGVLAPGERDLGDLVFRRSPVLVAGRVVDAAGEPVEGCHGYVQELRFEKGTGGGPDREVWRSDQRHRFHTEKDGVFVVRGEAPAGQLRLAVQPRPHHTRPPPIGFAAGTEDLVVALQEGSMLRVTVLVDDEVPATALDVVLRSTDGSPLAGGQIWGHESWASPGSTPVPADPRERPGMLAEHKPGRFTYSWVGLRPAVHELCVELVTGGEPLALLPAIELVAGEANHVDDIDLRGRLRAIRVRVLDPAGNPVNSRDGGVLVRPDQDASLVAFPIQDGTAVLVIASSAVDLLVAVPDFRPARVDGVRADIEVRLKRPMQVVLQVDGGRPELPDGVGLLLALHRVADGAPLLFRTRHMTQTMPFTRPLDALHRGGSARLADASGRTVHDVVAAGRYRVVARLLRVSPSRGDEARAGAGAEVAAEPGFVEVRDGEDGQAFPVRLDPGKLQEAVDRIGKGPAPR